MNDNLKIARIPIKVEKVLGLTLANDLNVYCSDSYLDGLAKKRPNDYLRIVEESCSIIRKPDFVSYDSPSQSMRFVRMYVRGDAFVPFLVEIALEGNPQKWWLSSSSVPRNGNFAPKGFVRL